MRRAAAIALRVPWLLGLIAGMIISFLRWSWTAAADGANLSGRWAWAPLVGFLTVVGIGVVVWAF